MSLSSSSAFSPPRNRQRQRSSMLRFGACLAIWEPMFGARIHLLVNQSRYANNRSAIRYPKKEKNGFGGVTMPTPSPHRCSLLSLPATGLFRCRDRRCLSAETVTKSKIDLYLHGSKHLSKFWCISGTSAIEIYTCRACKFIELFHCRALVKNVLAHFRQSSPYPTGRTFMRSHPGFPSRHRFCRRPLLANRNTE